MGAIFSLILWGLLAFLYFLPSIIAHNGKKRNINAIFFINLFLGWTFIGWLVALVWAMTKDAEPQIIVVAETGAPIEAAVQQIKTTSKKVELHPALRLLLLGVFVIIGFVIAVPFLTQLYEYGKQSQLSQEHEKNGQAVGSAINKTGKTDSEPNFISLNGKVIPNPKKRYQS